MTFQSRAGRRAISTSVIAVLISAAALLVVPAAQAGHKNFPGVGWLSSHTWKVCIIASTGRPALERALSLVSASDVNASEASCTGSNNATANASQYPYSWYGSTTCTGSYNASTGACSYKNVRLNIWAATTTAQRRKSACHEFGHVGGLGHRSNNASCLTSGAAPPIDTVYDSHDINALNNTY